jgi:hypothetical protein
VHLKKQGLDYYFTAWEDNKPVHMLSSFPTYKDTCERSTKDGGGRKKSIPIPSIIKEVYNPAMGGTDKHDQLNVYYDEHRRCLKWQLRIFSHFLRSALTNSYICYREVKNMPSLDLLAYQLEVIKEWVGGYTNEVISDEEDQDGSDNDEFVPKKSKKISKKGWIDAFKTRSTSKHTPITVEHDARKKCVECPKKSSHECSQCGVSVHIGCWEKFHDEENPF